MLLLSESGVSSDNEDDEDEDDGNYLHPSLFASKKCSRLEELMKVVISSPRGASAAATASAVQWWKQRAFPLCEAASYSTVTEA